MSAQPLLTVEGLSMRFGGLLAVNNVGLTLNQGEIVSLIGPNGAGKTTIFNCLTGFYRPTSGAIRLRERQLAGCPARRSPGWAWCAPSSTCVCSAK
ncbi:LIV-I protein F [Serratia rubidaea]|uniref:High-affinity branched-chain amino acid transport ATP-binding protein LivG n=1 Tax=Serratia rubidaea TaxID=61652 RepID=A0A4U9H885_SERRU|nr:LIV-I protein F [Serratia rubidaea]